MEKQFYFIDTRSVRYDNDNYRSDKLENRLMFFGTSDDATAMIESYNKNYEDNFKEIQKKKAGIIQDLMNQKITELSALRSIINPAIDQALKGAIRKLELDIEQDQRKIDQLLKKSYWHVEGSCYMEMADPDMTFNWYVDANGKVQTYEKDKYSYNLEVQDAD